MPQVFLKDGKPDLRPPTPTPIYPPVHHAANNIMGRDSPYQGLFRGHANDIADYQSDRNTVWKIDTYTAATLMLKLPQICMEPRNDLLHTLPPPTRPHQRQSFPRMDCRASLWSPDAPLGRHNSGSLYITLGKEETVHASGNARRIVLAIYTSLDC